MEKLRRIYIAISIFAAVYLLLLAAAVITLRAQERPEPVRYATFTAHRGEYIEQNDKTETAVSVPTALPKRNRSAAPVTDERVSLGVYRVTAYCPCEKCCGEWAKNRPDGIVYGAAGVELEAGVSCASPLPFGTPVEVDGIGNFIVQDRLANWVVDKYGEKLIDVYFETHDEVREFGCKWLEVFEGVAG